MKSYTKILVLITYFFTGILIYTQELQDFTSDDLANIVINDNHEAPTPINAPEQINGIPSQAIPENGIPFICDNNDHTTGRYWPKNDLNKGFAYINDLLYNNVIESKTKPASDEPSNYLGYFTNEQLDTIHLYGNYEEVLDTNEEEDNHKEENQID